ncbi:hypothetical protein FRC09_006477 [Ceratobasidium sp. 395]|nr:hypothetical protein FRC09_006477 [Ceratobasidium sp. 395]
MDLLDVLISGHRRMEVAKYFVVASRTLLFYDIITNIDDEIRYIWSKPWSLVRFIYHVNRLWPVVLLGATTPAFFVPSPSAQVDLSTSLDPMTLTALSKICKAIVVAGSYGTALAIVCPGFVMTLRVWALYERQKMVLFWLLLGQTCLALPALIEIKLQADHNMYLGNPAPGVLTGHLWVDDMEDLETEQRVWVYGSYDAIDPRWIALLYRPITFAAVLLLGSDL